VSVVGSVLVVVAVWLQL